MKQVTDIYLIGGQVVTVPGAVTGKETNNELTNLKYSRTDEIQPLYFRLDHISAFVVRSIPDDK